MIQRYSITLPKSKLSERFEAAAPKDYKPNFNASQSNQLPIITSLNPERIVMFQWGLIPFSSKDPLIGDKLINARVQTLKVKSPFCDLIGSKRCIILADSFFAWQEAHNMSMPHRVMMKSEQAFGIAGVWDEWRMEGDDSSIFNTFSMITTGANTIVGEMTDRMPAILPIGEEKKWLTPKLDLNEAIAKLQPYDSKKLKIYRVSNLVNNLSANNNKVTKEINTTMPGETLSLFD